MAEPLSTYYVSVLASSLRMLGANEASVLAKVRKVTGLTKRQAYDAEHACFIAREPTLRYLREHPEDTHKMLQHALAMLASSEGKITQLKVLKTKQSKSPKRKTKPKRKRASLFT
jgi:hypothetical protein